MVTELAALVDAPTRWDLGQDVDRPLLLIRVPALESIRGIARSPGPVVRKRRRLRREVRRAAWCVTSTVVLGTALGWMMEVRMAVGGDFDASYWRSSGPGDARPVNVSLSPDLETEAEAEDRPRSVALRGYVVPEEGSRDAGP